MANKQNNKKEKNYEFLDLNLLNSLIESKDYPALINYTNQLGEQQVPPSKQKQYDEELKLCQNIVTDYFLSHDEKRAEDLIDKLFDLIDPFPEVYEKVCAKFIEHKSPEEAAELYYKYKKQFFYSASHTLLKYISSNTKSAKTCLYFINDLEQSYKKYGVNNYNEHILDFYERFRAVCSKDEFEEFIQSGMKDEQDLQKQ